MEQEYSQLYQMQVIDRGLPSNHFHSIGEYQWTYYKQLADECNVKQLGRAMELLYKHISVVRRRNLTRYKLEVYRLKNGENDFDIIASD